MVIQPLIGILISWVYKPLRNRVDEFIPYGNVMGVDRPWHIRGVLHPPSHFPRMS